MKYTVKFTSQFKKDVKRAKRQNKDLNRLFEVIEILAVEVNSQRGIAITSWSEPIRG